MQSVYLANQTCWSLTDKFTQELKKRNANPPPFLSDTGICFWLQCVSGEKNVLICLHVFLPSVCVFLLSYLQPPPRPFFLLFVFFIFVIGVINGGRGWSCPQACFSVAFLTPLKDGAGSNKFSPWTFSPLSLPLCLFPQKQEISSSYKHDWTLRQACPQVMFSAAIYSYVGFSVLS